MTFTCHYDSPLGGITLAATESGLCGLWFDGQKYFGHGLKEEAMTKETPLLLQTRQWLDVYFSGQQPDFCPPLQPSGTHFQQTVWQILSTIPYGETRTYKDIAMETARRLGRPHMAAQAVGNAIGHNPISILIPCHRVIGSGGKLTGYTGGLNIKIHQVDDLSIKRTIGKTLVDTFSIMTGITDADTLETFRKEYVKEADQHMTANTILFPETEEVLRALKANGARIGIISTKYRYRIMELMGKIFPEGFIDIIVGGEDVKEAKPSPEGLLQAASRLNCPKEQILYLGDSTVDAETAQNAGVDFAGILHGMTTREELAAYPHTAIFPDLLPLIKK